MTSYFNWNSAENEVLFNPRLPLEEKTLLAKNLENIAFLKKHIWVSTSGSTGQIKWVALAKEGILLSAEAVNQHLESNHQDIWFNSLPHFHVGGMGVYARAYHSGAKVFDYEATKWHPRLFYEQIKQAQATLTSLVPTQLFDLVAMNLTSPTKLRAIIIGGGKLSEELYHRALNLGWKILPSYGLTECCSQVATASLDSWQNANPTMTVLKHVQLDNDDKGYLKIKSHSLLTSYAYLTEEKCVFEDPKIEGWFKTEDKGEFENNFLKTISRDESFIKIGGESVDLNRLEKKLESAKFSTAFKLDVALIAMPDKRLDHAIHLVVGEEKNNVSFVSIKNLISHFNQNVYPFEQFREVHFISKIPRSPLNKLLRAELKKYLLQNKSAIKLPL